MCTSIMSIIVTLFFSIFCFVETTFATNVPNMVLMNFSNNTQYEKINSPVILSEFLLGQMITIPYFNLMEHNDTKDVLDAEKRLNADESTIKDAMAKDDFAYIFEVHTNDVNQKGKGEFVQLDDVQVVAKKHKAEYVFHGSIDYLDSSVKEFATLYKSVDGKNLCIEARVTARIIDASNGKIVWSKSVKGIGSDEFVVIEKNFYFGTEALNAELVFDALRKASKKIVKELNKDLEKCNLVL